MPDYERPAGMPREFAEHAQLMFDLMTLALQTDSTRILTFMFTNAGSNRSYPQIDVREGHHNLSHHGRDAEKQEKIAKINRYHVQLFRYLIEKLATTEEGEGSLLDQCMVMYGSGIGDGNRHNHDDLPILLLGRGGGSIRPGRHLVYARNTPLTNLYRSMLERVDTAVDQFGDSTGVLNDLAERPRRSRTPECLTAWPESAPGASGGLQIRSRVCQGSVRLFPFSYQVSVRVLRGFPRLPPSFCTVSWFRGCAENIGHPVFPEFPNYGYH